MTLGKKMKSNAVFAIYQLINPLDSSPFYIGVTCCPLKSRLAAHISETKLVKKCGGQLTAKQEIIYNCILGNKPLIIEQIDQVVGLEAKIRERQWIFYYLESGVSITNNAHEERIFRNVIRNYQKGQ